MPEQKPETIVLLHGIGHTRLNMLGMARLFAKEGYTVLNISYPSTRMGLTDIAAHLSKKPGMSELWQSGNKVHFVTHSMGGLVAQKYLETLDEMPRQKMGRLVMLGTPNRGSEVADYMKDFRPYRWFYGQAGQELTTRSRQSAFKTPFYETGIIAGTASYLYPVASSIIRWNTPVHDGRVTVESTRIPGMTDHISLPVTHGLLAWSPSAQSQTIYFIKNGVFKHE